MIETREQAQAAVKEIQSLTGWSINKIGRDSDIEPSSLKRIMDGDTKSPTKWTRLALWKTLKKVRNMPKVPPAPKEGL